MPCSLSRYGRRKPGPKGPSAELITAIVEMKHRNPMFGCVRTAQQIAHAFGIEIDKDVVRRVLAKHYRPGDPETNGPCWLTFIGHRQLGRLWRFAGQSIIALRRSNSAHLHRLRPGYTARSAPLSGHSSLPLALSADSINPAPTVPVRSGPGKILVPKRVISPEGVQTRAKLQVEKCRN